MAARLLVLSVDGASADAWQAVAAQFASVSGSVTKVLSEWPLDARSAWAELLTGKKFPSSNVFGYARPTSSLSNLDLYTETDIDIAGVFADTQASGLIVNIPLMLPAPNRIFSSDGTPGIRAQVDFSEAAGYRPRAYTSVATARGNLVPTVEALCRAELARLSLARNKLETMDCTIACIRISFFDQIAHILGADWFLMEKHVMWPRIQEFMRAANAEIGRLRQLVRRWAVISTFGHTRCEAAINVNLLLERGGYCARKAAQPAIRSRELAVAKIRGEDEQFITNSKLMYELAPQATRAASPSAACIYINGADRFVDGNVMPMDRNDLVNSVCDYLSAHLHSPAVRLEKLDSYGPNAPDIIIDAPGMDLSSYSDSAIDVINKPAAVHSKNGFAIISEHEPLSSFTELHQLNGVFTELVQ